MNHLGLVHELELDVGVWRAAGVVLDTKYDDSELIKYQHNTGGNPKSKIASEGIVGEDTRKGGKQIFFVRRIAYRFSTVHGLKTRGNESVFGKHLLKIYQKCTVFVCLT